MDECNFADVLGKIVDMGLRIDVESIAAQELDAMRLTKIEVDRAQNLIKKRYKHELSKISLLAPF